MAKLRPVRPKGKSASARKPGAIPCIAFLILLMGLLLLLFYGVLKGS